MKIGTECRSLRTDAEHGTAREVVRRQYEKQGYISDGRGIASYLETPDAATFGLFYDETLCGTISIVFDSPKGLPMDSTYADELAPWRAAGKKLAEVVQFAADNEAYANVSGEKAPAFLTTPLFAAVFSRALRENVDYLCITVNPKHERFYRLLGFVRIGGPKQYASVNAGSVACAFYLPEWDTHPAIETFLGKEILRHLGKETLSESF